MPEPSKTSQTNTKEKRYGNAGKSQAASIENTPTTTTTVVASCKTQLERTHKALTKSAKIPAGTRFLETTPPKEPEF